MKDPVVHRLIGNPLGSNARPVCVKSDEYLLGGPEVTVFAGEGIEFPLNGGTSKIKARRIRKAPFVVLTTFSLSGNVGLINTIRSIAPEAARGPLLMKTAQ